MSELIMAAEEKELEKAVEEAIEPEDAPEFEEMKDEFQMRDELREKRKEIKTFDDLIEFLRYVKDNCNYDYGVAPRSMAQAALATAWYLSSEFGITGFQAGFVMWDFVRDWLYSGNTCGLRMVNYDDMLYPQYRCKFEKNISVDCWHDIQKAAKKNLEEHHKHVHPDVKAHWQSIVDGTVPFGYQVVDD